MAALTTSLGYTTGVPNPTIDAINAAIDEINLAGGDLMGDRVPNMQTKMGTVAVTSAKLTESATAGFTITGCVFSTQVEPDAGANYSWATSDATATTVTWTRATSAAADVISYIFVGTST